MMVEKIHFISNCCFLVGGILLSIGTALNMYVGK